MPYPLSIRQNPEQNLKQTQRLMMTPQMQQAIQFLQLPVQELTALIDEEIEQNPIIEYMPADEEESEEEGNEFKEREEREVYFDEHNFAILKQLDEEYRDFFAESGPPNFYSSDEEKRQNYLEGVIQDRTSLFDFLMRQAREVFSEGKKIDMAEAVIGYLDEKGFLKNPIEEIALLFSFPVEDLKNILKVVQTFEPSGVGATSLQESLLLQLENRNKKETLAYKIIQNFFNDLLRNKILNIQKGLNCTAEEVRYAIKQDIVKLDLKPGTSYSKEIPQIATPDVTIKQEGAELLVVINDEIITPIRLNSKYLRLLDDPTLPEDAKHFIKLKILSAKWLMKNIHQRNETIRRIAQALAERQKKFFMDPFGKLLPLTMKRIAQDLDLHESTIVRAVSNKYIDTPRGLFPIRHFFSGAYLSDNGEDISTKTVKEVLSEIVKKEDKSKPLSDDSISKLIKLRGISCARRTVAKYRAELNIGNASQRKL